jgi:5-formyltetrahydrofolate cyclo-ligase
MMTTRRSLPPAVHRSAAASLQTHLDALVRRERPSTIAAYVPVGSEPGGVDLPSALAAALPTGGRLLLPVLLDDRDLDWSIYEGPHRLRSGPRGLQEPAGARLGVDAVRLGRGGGSYDRALARAAMALTVALLHDGELVEHVPAEPHDRPVRAAVTPSGGVTVMRVVG